MGITKLRNESDNKFTDISSEMYRTYVFPEGEAVTIEGPLQLSVSASGGHRVLAVGDGCYYIPPKWIAIQWKPRGDNPHFVK